MNNQKKISFFNKIFFLIDKNFFSLLLLNVFFIINSTFELLGLSIIIWYSAITLNEKIDTINSFDFINLSVFSYEIIGYIIIILFVIKFLFSLLNNYFITNYCLDVDRKIKKKILLKLSQQDYLDYIKFNSSYYFNKFINISAQFSNSVLMNLLSLISNIIICTGIIIFLFYLNFSLTLVFSTVFLITYTFLYFISKKKIENLGLEINNNNKKIFKHLREVLDDFKSSYIYDNFFFYIKKLDEITSTINRKILIKRMLIILPKHMIELLILVAFIVLIILTNSKSFSENLNVVIITFGLSSLRLIPSINSINISLLELKFSNKPTDELYDFLVYLPEKKGITTSLKSIDSFENIKFENVSLNYSNANSDINIIKNINFDIVKGDFVGILGKSGSGKTSILNLITTLINPTSGKILINGSDISNINLKSYRNLISFISQDQFILDDTIKNNITLASNFPFDEKKFLEAIEKAKVNNFVCNLPRKFETLMGDKGAFFSGGQIQRIIIARSIYNEKQIHILDEATNALDKQNQLEIFEDMKKNLSNKTVIIVTHDKDLKNYFNKIIEV
jgi:ABC-type branched-subunit amino acid transport system ATPase component